MITDPVDGEYDLTMYVPTKGRPDNAERLQEQFHKTTRIMSRIVFINSLNDPKLELYKNLDEQILVQPDKPGFVSPLNKGYLIDQKKVYSFAVGFMGDDHMPRTDGWDEDFVQALLAMESSSGFVYGNDGFQGANVPTQIAMTSDIPLALGFMTLPRLSHLFADNFWLDLGTAINRIKYLPNTVLEHMHPAIGKANFDAGYEFSGALSLHLSDRSIYQMYLDMDLEGDVRIVKNMIRRKEIK